MSFRVIAIGEVLWDILPTGHVLGGAPANFAYHAHALGAEASLVSRIGNDPLGREILRRLQAAGIATDLVSIDFSGPTGTVTVSLNPDGQPTYTIHEKVAWDHLQAGANALNAAAQADAICFGSLAQRSEISRAAIQKFVAATPARTLRVFDINLRQAFYTPDVIESSLRLANVLKLNDGELPVLANLFDLPGDVHGQIRALADRFELRAVALTRGNAGSVLFAGSELSEHPGIDVIVQDTVGAGDAFTAALTLGLLNSWPLERINQRANEIAAFVCSQPGATPTLPEALRHSFQSP